MKEILSWRWRRIRCMRGSCRRTLIWQWMRIRRRISWLVTEGKMPADAWRVLTGRGNPTPVISLHKRLVLPPVLQLQIDCSSPTGVGNIFSRRNESVFFSSNQVNLCNIVGLEVQ